MPYRTIVNIRLSNLACLLAFIISCGCGAKQEPAAERSSQSGSPVGSVDDHEAIVIEPQELNRDRETSSAVSDQIRANTIGAPPPVANRSAPAPTTITSATPRTQSAEPRAARSSSAEPLQTEPLQTEPLQTEPLQTEPLQTEPLQTEPLQTLPSGATRHREIGYATVSVYYATDRQRDSLPLSSYNVSGNRDAFLLLGGCAITFFLFAGLRIWRQQVQQAIAFGAIGVIAAASATVVLTSGTAKIEKHGVRYSGDRGTLVKGVCTVTVPDTHQRGVVERPSLLRFEIREDQRDHIVLTSAIELTNDDFQQRLAKTVSHSPNQDLLVFIHGYNVDFESAVRRTAQLSVDLPFEGVPICYSWPSQGKLFGYTIDETNAAWTQTHLKQFLVELANQSGARSINVVAHSMGNRPATGAMVEIAKENGMHRLAPDRSEVPSKPFDRLVLAAPDVDADRFRRDLGPVLGQIADHVTLYASSDDQALIASKQVHGYPRAGESGSGIVVVPGIETIDVSGIDLSLLGHSYYGDNQSMLRDMYQVVRDRLPAPRRSHLMAQKHGESIYWKLLQQLAPRERVSVGKDTVR